MINVFLKAFKRDHWTLALSNEIFDYFQENGVKAGGRKGMKEAMIFKTGQFIIRR